MKLTVGKVYCFNTYQSTLNKLLVIGYHSGKSEEYDVIILPHNEDVMLFSPIKAETLNFEKEFPVIIMRVRIENSNIFYLSDHEMLGTDLRPYYVGYSGVPIISTDKTTIVFNRIPVALEDNPTLENGTLLMVGYISSRKTYSIIGKVTSNGLSTSQDMYQISFDIKNNRYLISSLADKQNTGIYIGYEDLIKTVTPDQNMLPQNNKEFPVEFSIGSTIAGLDPYSTGEVQFEILNRDESNKVFTLKVLNEFHYYKFIRDYEYHPGQIINAILDPTNTLYQVRMDKVDEIGFRMRVV